MLKASCTRFHEPLESRQLFATTYDFGTLTGYTGARTDATYDYTFSANGGALGSDAGSGPSTVTTRRTGSGANRKWTVAASTELDFGDNSRVFKKDNQGVNIVTFQTTIAGAELILNLHGTRVAPNSVAIGKTYTDTGTFSGPVGGTVGSFAGTGTVSGNTTSTSRLLKTETITVPAGRFNTVKGTNTLVLKGTARINVFGVNQTVDFNATYATTFWAVNRVGVVRQRETTTLTFTFTFAGQPQKVTVTTSANLVSSSALAQPKLQRAPLFSSTPIAPAA